MLKVGLTYDLKDDWQKRPDDPSDINAELDKPKTIDRVAAALESGGHIVKRIGSVYSLLAQIDRLDVDIVFNMCEGHFGRNRESQVPILLEMKGIPFVGADGLTLGITLDKIVTKKLLVSEGIPTAPFFEAKSSSNLAEINAVGFPLIVKTRHEGTSKGLTRSSRVEDAASLKRQVDIINKRYHQPALVEKFIRGTEFTVAVIGNDPPQAMPVAQVCIDGSLELGDEFYTFERVCSPSLRYVCPAQVPDKLKKRLQELAVGVYKCVECRDLGRIDFRVDEKGQPYVLEINPLPSLEEGDVFNLFPPLVGSTYDETINQILGFALKRYGMGGAAKKANKVAVDQALG